MEKPANSYKRYNLLVKVFAPEGVEHLTLEVFTKGLRELLEIRRVHSQVFKKVTPDEIDNMMYKN